MRSILAILLAGLSGPALAVEAPNLYTGPVARLDFAAENRTDGPLACTVELAHWYSADLGQVAPGASLAATLWTNPADGTVYLLNKGGDRMPVLALWCGAAGMAWATGTTIPLERRADAAPGAIAVVCEGSGDGVECR